MELLVRASEAAPDTGFMARLMMLCSLPRTNPGNRHQYKRVNGPYKLILSRTGEYKLPYGNLPRLLLAWVCTEAVRTQSRELFLGDSLAGFMRKLDVISSDSGGSWGIRTRLKNQMDRLFSATISLIYKDERLTARMISPVATLAEFWWNPKRPDEPMLWGEQDRVGREILQGDHRSPRTAGHEHTEGYEALFVRSGLVPLAHLPHLRAPAPAKPLLAAVVPSVRSGPGQGQRQAHR